MQPSFPFLQFINNFVSLLAALLLILFAINYV